MFWAQGSAKQKPPPECQTAVDQLSLGNDECYPGPIRRYSPQSCAYSDSDSAFLVKFPYCFFGFFHFLLTVGLHEARPNLFHALQYFRLRNGVESFTVDAADDRRVL